MAVGCVCVCVCAYACALMYVCVCVCVQVCRLWFSEGLGTIHKGEAQKERLRVA